VRHLSFLFNGGQSPLQQEIIMARDAVKTLKQSLHAADDEVQAKRVALELLRHSLRLGHRRLSLKRLEAAVGYGAEVPAEDLQRCAELALRVNDVRVHERVARLSRQLAETAC
jgi:hypothetical protein